MKAPDETSTLPEISRSKGLEKLAEVLAGGAVVEDANGRVWPADPPALPKGVCAAERRSSHLLCCAVAAGSRPPT